MLMPLFHLETNPIMNMTETSAVPEACEKILGSLCIVLMVFIVHKDSIRVFPGLMQNIDRGDGNHVIIYMSALLLHLHLP